MELMKDEPKWFSRICAYFHKGCRFLNTWDTCVYVHYSDAIWCPFVLLAIILIILNVSPLVLFFALLVPGFIGPQ